MDIRVLVANYAKASNKAITKDDITITKSVFSKVSEVDLVDVVY